jgi:hypothetical protein
MGWVEEGSLTDLRKKGIVCDDGVHLAEKANSIAAVNLYDRLVEMKLLEENWDVTCRRILNRRVLISLFSSNLIENYLPIVNNSFHRVFFF